MLNSIYEVSIKPEFEKKEKFYYIFFKTLRLTTIVLAVLCFILAFWLDNRFWIILLILIFFAIILHLLQIKFYNFYDYTLVSDNLSITQVINNVKIRPLISFDFKNIVKIGTINGENYLKLKSNKEIKVIDTLGSNIYNVDYYVLVNKNGKEFLVLLKFDKVIMSSIVKSLTANVLDDDYKENLKDYV